MTALRTGLASHITSSCSLKYPSFQGIRSSTETDIVIV
jgi:hypothetical protein